MAEFCCAELAGRLRVSPWAAASLMADGLDITIRLPHLWARVERFEVKVSYARHVARRTRDLTVEQAAYVDSRVAESADGRVSWTRFAFMGLLLGLSPVLRLLPPFLVAIAVASVLAGIALTDTLRGNSARRPRTVSEISAMATKPDISRCRNCAAAGFSKK